MVTREPEAQSQTSDPILDLSLPGAETPPADVAPVDDAKPGAEQDASPEKADAKVEPRTYSTVEWDTRESKKDKEVAGFRDMAASLALRLQAEQAQAAEAKLVTADARAVDNGDLSEDEARQRAVQRVDDRETAATRETERRAHTAMMAQSEQAGWATAIYDLGNEFGVDMKELAAGTTSTSITPGELRLKARELALDKREAAFKEKETVPETFDGGGGGGVGAGGAFDNMTGDEKIRWALAHPPKGS